MVVIMHFLLLAFLNAALITLGFIFIRKHSIWQSWLLMIIAVATAHFIFLHDNPVIRMLGIIATTFTGMKVIAVAVSYRQKALTLKFFQWVVFASGWAGMRAEPFESLGGPALTNSWAMIRSGISRVVMGGMLLLIAHLVKHLYGDVKMIHTLITICLLVGFSLILHFGLLCISAGTWRLKGVNTYLLFRQPVKATSLTELWSKRWNIAFSEMTSLTVFRPLIKISGANFAFIIAFLFSGLLHELALSLPVNSGYGLPTLYFLIQGVGVLLEKQFINHKIGILQNKLIAHTWVFIWIVLPMPLLFHQQFVDKVLWPMAGL